MRATVLGLALLLGCSLVSDSCADHLVYEGTSGPGKGKHIVFVANDHEYRSEQTCPLLAKLLAKHHGFRCTVLFGIDSQGCIEPGGAQVPGMEALQDADLLVFFTRFMNLPDDQVQHLVDYLERGGPVVGMRTSTHCFNGQAGTWSRLNYNHEGVDYRGGLGEQVFGNTWNRQRGQSHYGTNHRAGCHVFPMAAAASHPILRGVGPMHAYSGAYKSQPPSDAYPLLEVQVLNTFGPSDDQNTDKPVVNAGWTRDFYVAPSGKKQTARVVYTSIGASEDLLDANARRFLINACLWAGGWEDAITKDLNVEIVGRYSPTFYTNRVYVGGVKPEALSGWDSEIMPAASPMAGLDQPRFNKQAPRILEFRPEMKQRLIKSNPDLKRILEQTKNK